jgi:thioredoxin reductase (NADPH)
MDTKTERVVIIGSGPAGWSAAIYAARANLQPLVIEGTPQADMVPLGQLAYTTEVENYPGFPVGNIRAFIDSAIAKERAYILPEAPKEHVRDGVPHYAVQGTELVALMKEQAINFGTRVMSDDVVSVDTKTRPFVLKTGYGETVTAHSIIIATGAKANYLGLPSEKVYMNRGVSACAVCDGALPRFRNKPLVVVGGGDSAVEEATYLTKFSPKVYMVHRRDVLRASKIMAERALTNERIQMVWDSAVVEILGEEKAGVTAVRVKNLKTGEINDLAASGAFMAIGHTPNTSFLGGQLETNEKGYLKLSIPFRTNTTVEGIFAAGDVADDYYRQAITSAGSGCMAALDAERWLGAQGMH